jgi:hypothetical protein
MTARSYGAFYDQEVAIEYARNVFASAPQECILDAFLKLAAKGFPKPSDVILRATQLKGERRCLPPPVQKFVVVGWNSTSGLSYDGVREIGMDQNGYDALKVGEEFIGEFVTGGDKVARWRAEWEAMPPEGKQKAENAKQRFKAALLAFLETRSMPGPKPTRISPDDERQFIKHMEHKGAA